MRFWLGVGILMVFMIAGCAHVPAGFAPSATPVEKAGLSIVGHEVGSSSYFSFLGFIPFGRPHYDSAIKDAVSKFGEGHTLINVSSWSTWTYIIIGSVYTLHVEGDVVKSAAK